MDIRQNQLENQETNFLCSIMHTSGVFCAIVGLFLALTEGDVVSDFHTNSDCIKFFYKSKVPQWGSATPGVAWICQRFQNSYHFATLYDTYNRIAVYSAYIFGPSNGGGRETRWFVEPQVRYKIT